MVKTYKSKDGVPKATKRYLRKNYPKAEPKLVGNSTVDNLNLLTPLVYNLTGTRQGDAMNERIGSKIRANWIKLSLFMHNGDTSAYHVRMVCVEHLDYSQAIDVTTPLYKTYGAGGVVTQRDFNSSQNNIIDEINTTIFRVVLDKMFFLGGDTNEKASHVRFNRHIKYRKELSYNLGSDADPREGRCSLCFQVYDADGNAIVTPTGINVGLSFLLQYYDN